MAEYVVTTTTQGRAIYLARRQNLQRPLLGDSVTRERRYAYRWSDADGAGYGLVDAATFRAHAESHQPLGWTIEEA